MSDHVSDALGGAAARAFTRSSGCSGSGSTATGAISSVTRSPPSAPAASRISRSTLSQWPPRPSGSSVAQKGNPLRVPSTEVMPREGSFALAAFGRVRKVQETAFAVAFGRKSFAAKRIVEAALVILAWYPLQDFVFGRCAACSPNDVRFVAHAVSRRTACRCTAAAGRVGIRQAMRGGVQIRLSSTSRYGAKDHMKPQFLHGRSRTNSVRSDM